MSRDFNKFRFEGLDYKTSGKSHWSMKRISDDESKIIVDVAPEQIFGTKYGFGLILDRTHVCFIKDWNVLSGMYGHVLVILSKQYFKAKEFGEHDGYADDCYNCTWDAWRLAAKRQAAANGERVLIVR